MGGENIIKNDIIILNSKFKKIRELGWVHTLRSGSTGVGYTFEKLIGKEEENFEIPDFGVIEIKTKCSGEKFPISLFSASPDGDIIDPIGNLQEKYGYPDKDFPSYKVLNIAVSSDKFTKLGYYKYFKLNVNMKEEKIELLSIYKGKKEQFISWSFYILQKKFDSKLKYLAVIDAKKKTLCSGDYYKYENINFYEFIGFNKFIELVKFGKIIVRFKIGIFKKGPKLGKRHDRGTSFSIYAQDLTFLYKKIEHPDSLYF